MQVALHFGAPFTDQNKLQEGLGKNRELLVENGVWIPRPFRFRKQMRPLMAEVMNSADPSQLRDDFLESLMIRKGTDRIVLSFDNFLGFPRHSIADNQFFPGRFNRLISFLRLFERDKVELFYGIVNPASYFQNLMAATRDHNISEITGYTDPMALSWSDFFERVIEDCPDAQITVWCNEDTPFLWEDILRDLAGVDASVQLEGVHDLLAEIMTAEGMARFNDYIKDRPDLTPIQKRRVIAAFLEKFADEDALEEEMEIPGWTEDVVDGLTELYDEDVYKIQSMPEIDFLEP